MKKVLNSRKIDLNTKKTCKMLEKNVKVKKNMLNRKT